MPETEDFILVAVRTRQENGTLRLDSDAEEASLRTEAAAALAPAIKAMQGIGLTPEGGYHIALARNFPPLTRSCRHRPTEARLQEARRQVVQAMTYNEDNLLLLPDTLLIYNRVAVELLGDGPASELDHPGGGCWSIR